MKINKYTFFLVCLVAMVFAIRSVYLVEEPEYSAEVIEIQPGNYGYKIKSKKKVIIYQPFVPALEEKRNFNTAAEAQKVATLVVERITTGKDFSITRHDLEKLGISISE